jgi:hypothetical protein
LLYGRFPTARPVDFWRNVRGPLVISPSMSARTGKWSEGVISFLNFLLKVDPEERPTARVALGHCWLEDEVKALKETPLESGVARAVRATTSHPHAPLDESGEPVEDATF